MKLEEILATGLFRLEVVKVRTAVDPLLWLVGLTTPVCLLAVALIDDPLVQLLLLGFAAIPIIVMLIAYFIFMFRDPDRLQSEKYEHR
jgi:hypothetical protein